MGQFYIIWLIKKSRKYQATKIDKFQKIRTFKIWKWIWYLYLPNLEVNEEKRCSQADQISVMIENHIREFPKSKDWLFLSPGNLLIFAKI